MLNNAEKSIEDVLTEAPPSTVIYRSETNNRATVKSLIDSNVDSVFSNLTNGQTNNEHTLEAGAPNDASDDATSNSTDSISKPARKYTANTVVFGQSLSCNPSCIPLLNV